MSEDRLSERLKAIEKRLETIEDKLEFINSLGGFIKFWDKNNKRLLTKRESVEAAFTVFTNKESVTPPIVLTQYLPLFH